jgi:phosphoribosylaminoimidazolecarboxamide formyltransferase/IMP cyclohydrolase
MTQAPQASDDTPTTQRLPIKRALISVYDKTGLEELARGLTDAGVELVSTGSTAARIAAAGMQVTPVEDLTGFPECLDGRVKTLHPRVHAGILADRRLETHRDQLAELEIEPFDLVVVNLYPFADTVASGASQGDVIEQIDIGGPSMVRGAAKNHPSVAIVVDPAFYGDVIMAVAAGGFTLEERQLLAAAAFRHTADYDIQVASWMGNVVTSDDSGTGFPGWMAASFTRKASLRYGENPHQAAALYTDYARGGGLAHATQLHGKEMSFNNYIDADAAVRAAYDHARPAVAIIKHANPCGVAVGESIAQAHARAHATDPVSAFGGVIASNGIVTADAASQIAEVFTEVVVAPDFEPAAIEILSAKKNIRLLKVDRVAVTVEWRRITGGLLVQHGDQLDAPGDLASAWDLVAGQAADPSLLADLEFAWRACRAVKSNAILLAKDGAAVGVGMGQVNRVDSCGLAVQRAGAERAQGAVAASDAFFPFADGLQVLIDAGVRAVVSPGGSMRDGEVIAAAQAAGITLYHTGTRHFAH